MSVETNFRNITGASKELTAEVLKQADQILQVKSLQAFGGIKKATPVDTGRARNSWTFAASARKGKIPAVFTISNNVPYIEKLNQGSSKQAGSMFIQQTIQKYTGVVPVLTFKE